MKGVIAGLVLAVTAAGLPPCAGRDMPLPPQSGHACDPAPDHSAPASKADCCVLSAPAESRAPVERQSAVSVVVLEPAVAPAGAATWLARAVEPAETGPPVPPGCSLHLLFSQFRL